MGIAMPSYLRALRGRTRRLAGSSRCSSDRLAEASRGAAPRFYPDDPIQIDRDTRVRCRTAQRRSRAATATTSASTPLSNPATGGTFPPSTSTRWTRFPIRAGSPTGSGGGRCPSMRSCEGRTRSTVSTSTAGPSCATRRPGITPGYRVTDPSGRLYQIKFDPPGNPEMASGAEVIGAAIYHALGYNVVEGLRRRNRPGDDRHCAERHDR